MSSAASPASAASSDRPFRCTHPGCHAAFPKAAKLDRHLRSHSDERPFVCQHPGCDASYKRSEHLKVHQRRHQDDSQRNFRCTEPGCDMAFWTSSHLKNHVQAVHRDETVRIGTRTFRLPAAEAASPQSAASPDTASLDGLTEYRCTEPGCTETFHKRKVLRAHIRQAHSDMALADALTSGGGQGPADEDLAQMTLLPFPCSHPGCSMRFATNAKRRSHFKTHEQGRYTCYMAHAKPQDESSQGSHGPSAQRSASSDGSHGNVYVFPNWSALQEHMRQFHPPTCPWPGCGKSFVRQDNLRAHYSRHEKRMANLEAEVQLQNSPLGGSSTALLSDDDDGLDDDEDNSSSESDGDEWRPLDGEGRSSSRSLLPASTETHDLEALASDLSRKRPRRSSSRLSTPESCRSARSASIGSRQDARGGAISPAADGRATFACSWNGCGRTYTRKSGLSIHIRTQHLGERPFECPGCRKKFAHKHLVARHRRVCSSMGPLAALRGAQLDRHQGGLGGVPRDPPQDEVSRPGSASAEEQSRPAASGEEPSTDVEDSEYGEDDVQTGADAGNAGADAGNANDDDEVDDDYFRREGGAVPEADAERDHSRDSHQHPQRSDSALKSRLLDLLTGSGYLDQSHATASSVDAYGSSGSVASGERQGKRRRATRNRIFPCPWQSIVEALQADDRDESTDDAERDPQSDTTVTAAEAAATEADLDMPACSHRFGRIYDLRRHLKASHGLELEDREIRGWLHKLQIERRQQGPEAQGGSGQLSPP
ncbi:uncharacterized protein PFL1_00604 [Pseudozyma flocculosa PF-1]|uniref:Related to Zinc finger protein n=1 Tax=Pseudozyma flocculosa TaxID=84751 RepID=A0A5C3EQN0_9BASI|nr:uncharacterized protein PFL1_00604 [Pseudozyma flocculosa PF-1]EPQ32408.1 hypothetical protein PFL1_00604 [Pseudozyma flocculosa PF-1]SPO34613.1 related to Zinc finger protein [Pseudozyma flocculosa]